MLDSIIEEDAIEINELTKQLEESKVYGEDMTNNKNKLTTELNELKKKY